MMSDRDLDARLAAAAGIHDDDLPALPDSFLVELHGEREPASVIAARQLVTDARQARSTPARRRRPTRRAFAALTTAAAAVVAVAVVLSQTSGPSDTSADPTTSATTAPPTDLGPLEAPPGGLALAATEAVTFPYSLDPEPPGLTPVLGMYGGLPPAGSDPVVWRATYQSADDPGFTFLVSTGDPRILPEGSYESIGGPIVETTTVDVAGSSADLVRGVYTTPSCGYAPSTPEQTETPDELCADTFAELTWQRPDGLWAQVRGEDDWSTRDAIVSVGASIVDVPQPVPLQVHLAPAGWTVSSYEDNHALTLISDTDPSFDNRISVSVQERWRGITEPDISSDAAGNPIEQVTVDGRPGELVSVPNGSTAESDGPRMWILEATLPDGLVFFFQAPGTLTHDQVLQIAAQVSYTP